jgi:hypothetical protein
MNAANEHDDDLEPEVNEGAEIETESYEDGPAAQVGDHEHEDESSDTL